MSSYELKFKIIVFACQLFPFLCTNSHHRFKKTVFSTQILTVNRVRHILVFGLPKIIVYYHKKISSLLARIHFIFSSFSKKRQARLGLQESSSVSSLVKTNQKENRFQNYPIFKVKKWEGGKKICADNLTTSRPW